LIIKNVTEWLTKKVRFSISFRVALSYVRWLFVSLLMFTLLINGALCFVLLSDIWNEMNISGSKVISVIKNSGASFERLENYILDKNLSVDIKDDMGKEIRKIGKSPKSLKFSFKDFKYSVNIDQNSDDIYFLLKNKAFFKGKKYDFTIYKNIGEKLRFLGKFLEFTLISILFIIFVTVIFGARSNIRVLKPLKDMTRTTKKISGNNLSLRINIEGIQDELKELAQTINEMMDRIENSYNQQQQFVSDASHELRTPIAVLQGYANLLDRWGKNDPQILQESITSIKNEADSMKELVEKLLFLARNDKNALIMQKKKFNLSELLYEMLKDTEIINFDHKVVCNIKESIFIKADRNRLKQAFRIFVDNAVKYTLKSGLITINAFEQEDKIVVSIKDNGIGISSEDIKYIFERFYRSDKSRSKEKGGHGLGLSIAKMIILGNNGKIKVRSKVGEGTEFIITFPKLIKKKTHT
jgi:two-component system, OmpR family, sensor histidine kinase ArlS